MDLSPEYIKMCEKAKEIQKGHKFVEGDYVQQIIDPDDPAQVFMIHHENDAFGDVVWLPRQDELQAMVTKKHDEKFKALEWVEVLEALIAYYESMKEKTLNLTQSWEQVWLFYVMEEKFNKSWDGEEWRPIT